jgi:aminopeptidase N
VRAPRVLGLLAALLLPSAPPDLAAATLPGAGFDVLDYRVDLDVRPTDKRIEGDEEIDLASRTEALREVDLEAQGLEIAGVSSGGHAVPFRSADGKLIVILDPPARQGETRTLRVRYAGSPQKGLRFTAGGVYTAFNTSSWLVSKSDPGDKATLTLRLTLPAGLEVAASGYPVSRETLPDGRERHVWREDRPYSAYLFGFAAAPFTEVTAENTAGAGPVKLRFLAPGLTPAQLATVFAGTGDMLRFFEERSGVPYPAGRYTQALLPDGPPQEMAEMALLDEDYGRSVLQDPREDSLVAHELSHQWWGNLLTCADWSDFWLNEGMATYMTAAWKEHAWGRDDYEREILLARRRYGRAVAEGKDRPLVFTGWKEAGEMGGPVTYSKGSLVLHLLRREIGDVAFWAGLRTYTRRAASTGGVVRTRDLQHGMEQASGRDLGWFFDQWAYATEPALTGRHHVEDGAVVVELEQRGQKPWRIGLRIAVETDRERVSRRVELTREKETFRIPVLGTPLSVRIDDGAALPRAVEHERPWPMRVYQARHEPDAAGRTEALLSLAGLCGTAAVSAPLASSAPSPECADLADLLRERVTEDPARIVRQIAERTLQDLTRPRKEIAPPR